MSNRYLRAVLTAAIAMMLTGVGTVMAAVPSNDEPSGATALQAGVPVEFDSSEATSAAGDPTDCDGSHGAFPGPYSASVWFSYTATARDKWLSLSAPTMQGHPDDFLAITFVYARAAGGALTLVDCTAYGNDATWKAVAGTTYLIMEAGLSSAVTEEPELSDRGGHGTVTVQRVSADGRHYAYRDQYQYADCGFEVTGTAWGSGLFMLKSGRRGDATPYYFENYEWHAVTVNPANGKWFREDGNGLYKDLRIINVEGTIYTFEAVETGRPFTLTDMDGNRVYADRGRLLTQFTVDTKGDDDLSNDEFIDGTWSLLAENGAHPGFFIEDWCAEVVVPLLGD
jgi:hypothetical protein